MAKRVPSKANGNRRTSSARPPLSKKPASKKSASKNRHKRALLPRLNSLFNGYLKKFNITPRHMLIAVCGIVPLLVLFTTIWLFTNKNAAIVYVAETPVGTIRKNKNIDSEALFALAQKKLEDKIGAKIQINEQVVMTPIHASSKNIAKEETIIAAIADAFTYKIEAAVITVEGIEILALQNQKEADETLNNIISSFIPVDANIVNKGFVEKVVPIKKFVDPEEIISQDKAYDRLTQNTETQKVYTVRSGDNLSNIASQASMSLNALYSLNPGIDEKTVLKIGTELVLVEPKPFLSVETVEEYKYPEVEPKQREIRQNPNEPKTASRVIQQGKDGQKEITAHIYRINGFEDRKEIISEQIIVAPVNDIIEVGTRSSN